MRVVIAGAGSVGTSIARELAAHDHDVTVIDRSPAAIRVSSIVGADWVLGDACELATLTDVHVESADVVVAATGDDKANLVLALLAKSEFGVPRVVGRVNNPKNEWMFDDTWGVDVAVSTPRIMTALVEEAVAVGDLVRIFTFRESGSLMVEITMGEDSAVLTRALREVEWPAGTVLTGIIRNARPIAPDPDETIEQGDELLFLVDVDAEAALRDMLTARREAAS
jgi:trk system potassium uptake protein TrkA